MKSIFLNALFVILTLGLAPMAHAAVIVTYAESPAATNSTLTGTSVLTFDTMALGQSSNVSWNGVGTFDPAYLRSTSKPGSSPGVHVIFIVPQEVMSVEQFEKSCHHLATQLVAQITTSTLAKQS